MPATAGWATNFYLTQIAYASGDPDAILRHGSGLNSSGGKERLAGITEAGNGYLRKMLMVGAMAVIRYAQRTRPRLVQLMVTAQQRSRLPHSPTRPSERCGP
jgi:hypothetical protein